MTAVVPRESVVADWLGQPLEDVLSRARDLVEDATFPTVRRWREAGGKVLGHFQVYFPEEIAHAAGLLPFKVRGAPLEPAHAESHFGSYLCSIIKTSLELALANGVELDAFITHPICDAARNLAGVWGRNVTYPCRILYLPQNPNSAFAATYLRDEYARIRDLCHEIAGRPVTDDGLHASIAVFNENRALLRRLYSLRREQPWLLPVDEAYVLVALAGLIPRQEHNALLRALLPQLKRRRVAKQDKIRVIVEGGFCEQPPLDLLRAIARSCYVVDDDLLIGLRWLTSDVPVTGEPLFALAASYIDRSAHSPVQHDLRKPKEKMLLERLDTANAQAAILLAAKMCEPGLEELVVHTRALDGRGVRYFVSEFEENMSSFDQLEIQLETFVENLLFD
ncbi:MAG TPA: 2-hydroxyacyl-CoA dehydratase [Gemmatimonadales bacterium]|nr:2-hydroxyacyl-CoA dehydratase [Gemmatimonadales bacterium]